jgi:hypothetical protein
LSWAFVMYIFRWQPESIQSSLRSSMKYMYVPADWSLGVALIGNPDTLTQTIGILSGISSFTTLRTTGSTALHFIPRSRHMKWTMHVYTNSLTLVGFHPLRCNGTSGQSSGFRDGAQRKGKS